MPFKKLPTDMRDHLAELTGNELKVWLYLHLRTGKEGTAFPSNQTIANAVGLNRETVKIAKKGLRSKGWSAKVMQRKRDDGSFSTVVEKTSFPWQVSTAADNGKPSHGAVAGKDGSGKNLPTEVDTLNLEGTAAPIQDSFKDSALTSGSESVSEEENSSLRSPSSPSTSKPQEPSGSLPDQKPLASEEIDLLSAIQPYWDRDKEQELGVMLREIISALPPTVCPYDLLRFNRSHKTGKLAIRTPKQFLAAINGNEEGDYTMLNEYTSHEHEVCKVCDKAGVLGPERIAKQRAEQKELADKKAWLAENQDVWNFEQPSQETMHAFPKIVNPSGVKGAWSGNSFNLAEQLSRPATEAQYWFAAINYVVERRVPVTLEEFLTLEKNAREYAAVLADVQNTGRGFDVEEA